jgi:hypothetical protein
VSADEVALAIAYLAHPSSTSTNGTVLFVDGGMERLRIPKQIDDCEFSKPIQHFTLRIRSREVFASLVGNKAAFGVLRNTVVTQLC